MSKTIISTPRAPAAIGTYSQAVKVAETVYLSGQIGLDPLTMQMVEGVDAQIVRVFDNLKAVAEAAGGSLADVVKLNIYLTDLGNFAWRRGLGQHSVADVHADVVNRGGTAIGPVEHQVTRTHV